MNYSVILTELSKRIQWGLPLAEILSKLEIQLETEISEDVNYKSILKAEVYPINPIPSDPDHKTVDWFHSNLWCTLHKVRNVPMIYYT